MTRWTQADVDRVEGRVAKYLANLPKPAKFGNRKTNGYASKREAKRAEELKLLEKAHKIVGLREQVEFELIPKQDGERSCKYVADFVYDQYEDDSKLSVRRVVEDAKGYRDPVYRIKRKLMLQVHGIRIREV
jgi:uncharacterized Fe-S cluster-containing protein